MKWILLPNSIKFGNGDGVKNSNVTNSSRFVFYTIDWKRFDVPLTLMDNNIFTELFKMSEEEFGITSDGPIMMPCDSALMSYIVTLVERGIAKDSENALLSIIVSSRCSLSVPWSQNCMGQQVACF